MTSNQIASVLNETRVGQVLRVLITHPTFGGYEARIRCRQLDLGGQLSALIFDDSSSSQITFGPASNRAEPSWQWGSLAVRSVAIV